MPSKDNDLLKEIRENFDYAVTRWANIRREAAMDMRYVSGNPWDPQERASRINAGRPVLVLDELGQYLNQVINDVRQNKRAIKVNPRGAGATDKMAAFQADLIRQIEYRSNAQAGYCTAFSGAVERGYGYGRIMKRYVDDDGVDQELFIAAIPNPDTVYLDPDYKEPDASDIEWAYILDSIRRTDFDKKYPDAKFTNFTTEHAEQAPSWIHDDAIQIAEYWKIIKTKRTLVVLDNDTKIFLDEIPGAKLTNVPGGKALTIEGQPDLPVKAWRKTETREVMQYVTNGVEILEETKWDGKYIPIGACFGKEMFVDDGAGVQRVLFSLVRLARDPAMLLNYYGTCEMEAVGQTPKSPYLVAEGQLGTHEQEWQLAAKVPTAVLYYLPKTDATGEAILPPPQKISYEPPVQALEIGKEAARRAIQAAMGISNLPTAAQRLNEKSGVALQRISTQQSQGSYHFLDNYDRFLEHMGRMLLDLIPSTYDAARDVAVRGRDESVKLKRINEPTQDENGQPEHLDMSQGDFEPTVSTGPSFQSQRESADEFASQVASPELFSAAIAGNPKASKIVALAVRLKNGGAIMDSIADVLDPQEQNDPNAMQQQVAQQQQQLQQASQVIQELKVHADKNQTELQKTAMETASREKIAVASNRTDIAKTILQHAGDHADAMAERHMELIHKGLDMAHESNMADKSAAEARNLQAIAQEHAAETAAQPGQ